MTAQAKYTEEDSERRLVRNEKARRRNALKAVLKPLPQEIEEKIYSYMRNWIGGSLRVDVPVPMRWQKHECAILIDETICNLRKIKYDTSDYDDHTHFVSNTLSLGWHLPYPVGGGICYTALTRGVINPNRGPGSVTRVITR